MALDRALFAGFTYLSQLTDPELKLTEYNLLSQKIKFIPEVMRPWFQKCLDDYSVYERFPALEVFVDAFQQEVVPEFSEADNDYHRQLLIWESDILTQDFSSLSILQRRRRMAEINNLLLQMGTSGIEFKESADEDIHKFFIKDESEREESIITPFKKINSDKILKAGDHITIMGSPGSGKSACALNMLYLNTFVRSYNCLYIYLENLVANYYSELYSRHSYVTGFNIENKSLKAKILPTETTAKQKIDELHARFRADIKGKIYFKAFSELSTEPTRFGHVLGELCDAYQIDLVIFDYAQRAAQFNTNPRLDRNTYVDMIVSSLASCALGAYNNRPFVSCVLSQLNREAMRKMEKTQSLSFTAFDGAGSSSLERDAFLIFGVYSNPVMRSEQRCSIKILKNRDGLADIETDDHIPFHPQYCMIGDFTDSKKDMTDYTLETAFDIDAFGL